MLVHPFNFIRLHWLTGSLSALFLRRLPIRVCERAAAPQTQSMHVFDPTQIFGYILFIVRGAAAKT